MNLLKMGKKNKKIKRICPSCNKKNTFAKENWNGEENTKCKYCGRSLVRIKEDKPVNQNELQAITIEKKETLYDVTRPSLNLYKLESKKKTWILCLIAITFIVACAFVFDNKDKNTLDKLNDYLNASNNSDLIPPGTTEELCSIITAVPSWAKSGVVFDKDYRGDWNVSYLIENKITFLYSTTCSACHKQIAKFGNQWPLYILSGYTKECW